MKLSTSCIAGLLFTSALASAAVVNDGTTTQGLLRLAPAPYFNPANATTLTTAAGGVLLASIHQQDEDDQGFYYGPNFPRLHSLWYGTAYVATGATYQASAHFRADQTSARLDGGVAGWVDETAGKGIVFALRKDVATYCEVATFNFISGTSVAGSLYDTNGVEMIWNQQPAAARSDLTAAFRPTNSLRLQVAFEPPTEADLEVLANATARLTAVGYQNNGSGEQVVTTPIVLLTAMPVPLSGEKLVGYYAVFSSDANRTGPIGWLDNLVIDGDVGLGNQLPTITLDSPKDGAKFGSGDPILLSATASDPAPGSVAQVEFFADSASLSVVSQQPYAFTWGNAAIGTHRLSAVVTDDRGAEVSSATVDVQVTNRPPAVVVLQPADGQVFAPGAAVVVEANPEDSDGLVVGVQLFIDETFVAALTPPDYGYSWIPDEIRSYTIRVEAVDDRGATGSSPTVTISVGQGSSDPATFTRFEIDDQGRVQLEWDLLGFQVQTSASLLGPWDDVPVNTTGGRSYSEPASGQPQYYRLVARGVSPSQPEFTAVNRVGSELVMTWSTTGRQVQVAGDLDANFADVPTNTTGVQEYRAPLTSVGRQFFRLR